MKRILCSFAIILFFSLSYVFGQARVDVITLKNGDVLKGEIIENVPNNYVKIELPGGSMLTVKYSDIEKFSRENRMPRERFFSARNRNKLCMETFVLALILRCRMD